MSNSTHPHIAPHLAPIDAASIRQRLQQYRVSARFSQLPQSAVLIPIDFSGDEPKIYFVQRSQHLNKHAGQIAFPGGKQEPADTTLEITALRETEEEIHLSREHVSIMAQLDAMRTRYNLSVTPYVGEVHDSTDIKPDLSEVDEVFSVSISDLLDTRHRSFHTIKYGAGKFSFPALKVHDKTIWGLTYFILADFLNHVYRDALPHKKHRLPTDIKPALLNSVYRLARKLRK